MEALQSNPTVLQSQISWGFPLSLWDPQIEKSDGGLELLQQCKNFFGIVVFQLWVAHLVSMGFDFDMIVPLLLSHCDFSLVLGCGVSYFGGFQPPINGCSVTSCILGVFTCSLKGCTM